MSLLGTLRGEHQRPFGLDGQWDLVPPKERNIFQIIAAKTGGVVTPGNTVTTAGLALGMKGINDYIDGEKYAGAVETALSFLSDVVDGPIAKASGTIGACGALFDASADKVRIISSEIALFGNPIPPYKSLGMAAIQISIIGGSMIIDKYGEPPDPTASGKIGMFTTALTKSAYMFREAYLQQGKTKKARLCEAAIKTSEPISFALSGLTAYRTIRRAIGLHRDFKNAA